MRYSRAKLEKAGESWVFGINTEAPAEEHLIAFLEQNGLKLAKYEPIGKGDEKQIKETNTPVKWEGVSKREP